MINGADLRRYRKMIGWKQADFAKRLGISQSALSLIENGQIAVSKEHLAQLAQCFDKPTYTPRFSEFLETVKEEKSVAKTALVAPYSRCTALTVWRWEEGLDLGQISRPDRAVGLLAIRATDNLAIALEMDRKTGWWERGEILVFESCDREEIEDGDLCLLAEVKRPRGASTQTFIAVARRVRATSRPELLYEPISPRAAIVPRESARPDLLLRLVFRGRYTHKGRFA
jgi:transcriptional regulator with XRE-family HTH domain